MIASRWAKHLLTIAALVAVGGCAGTSRRGDLGPPNAWTDGSVMRRPMPTSVQAQAQIETQPQIPTRENDSSPIVRGQSPGVFASGAGYPASPATRDPSAQPDYYRRPMHASGQSTAQVQYTFGRPPLPTLDRGAAPPSGLPPANVGRQPRPDAPLLPPRNDAGPAPDFPSPGPVETFGMEPMSNYLNADVDIHLQETETGRFMFGVGVNSDAGVTGNIVVDERNFDIMRWPTSFRDFASGKAWRGGGQAFRVEALPGTVVQRYLASFTEPNLLNTNISLSVSGFFYNRRYIDWDEERLGGRIGLGYRLAPDLSVSTSLRMENVTIYNPRLTGAALDSVPELRDAIGDTNLYGARFTLSHDTRDIPFSPTEGHLLEVSYEQVFGTFDYPRGNADFRKYFLVTERPDGSGRHVLGYSFRLGVTGGQTPIFENYFAGGYSTIRGFNFRGASPKKNSVDIGGEFQFLGAVEYMFPLTADDMLKGVVFCDFGTVEEKVEIHAENYRIAPGFGLRIFVPAMGPAPIALDFAFPVAKAATDETEVFSFFIGFGR